jgi:hypothetical protein
MNFPTQSQGFLTQSANFPTQSVDSPYPPNSQAPTPPYFPLQTTTMPAITSSVPKEATYSAAMTFPTAGPLLYTGRAPDLRPIVALYVSATLVALYLAL